MKGANYLVGTFCTSLKNQVVVEVFFESLDQTSFRNRNKERGKEKFDKNERAAEMTVLFIEEVADI